MKVQSYDNEIANSLLIHRMHLQTNKTLMILTLPSFYFINHSNNVKKKLQENPQTKNALDFHSI